LRIYKSITGFKKIKKEKFGLNQNLHTFATPTDTGHTKSRKQTAESCHWKGKGSKQELNKTQSLAARSSPLEANKKVL
jgi:hypothetical protein